MLPVKTARDPDPTGSPTHMDSRSRIARRRDEGDRICRPSSGNHWFLRFEVRSIIERQAVRLSNARMIFRISRNAHVSGRNPLSGSREHTLRERSGLLINDDAGCCA